MKNVDRACISRISIKPCKLQERTAGPQGGPDKRRKNVGEGAQGKKTPVGKKCPPKTAALAVRR